MTEQVPVVGTYLVPTEVVFLVLATVPFILRLYGRIFLRRNAGWDDLYIVLAYICAIIILVTHILAEKWGLGRHYVDLVYEDKPKLWLTEFIMEWVFPAGCYFTKLSILCFYLRFAEGASRRLQIAIYVTMGFLTIWMLSFSIAVSCSCTPIRKWWDTEIPGSCWPNFNIGMVLFLQITLNTLSDIIIFVLPIKTVWKIQAPLRQKMQMIALLGLGLIICIVSLVRIKFVLLFLVEANDNSWYAYALYVSIAIEIDLSIAAACLPFCRPAAKKIIPEVKKLTSSSSSKWTPSSFNSKRRPTREHTFNDETYKTNACQQKQSSTRPCQSEENISKGDPDRIEDLSDKPKSYYSSTNWDVEMGTWRSRDDDSTMAGTSRTIKKQEIMSVESLEKAMKRDSTI